MNFFSKVKGSAIQGLKGAVAAGQSTIFSAGTAASGSTSSKQAPVAGVITAAAAAATVTTTSNAIAEVPTGNATTVKRTTASEFVLIFAKLCEALRSLSGPPNGGAAADAASPLDLEKKLHASMVPLLLAELLSILIAESSAWEVDNRQALRGDSRADLVTSTPCIDAFVHHQMAKELVKHANNDNPRGSLTLVLQFFAILLQEVNFPMLLHKSIHKPLAGVAAVASRFDALFAHQYLTEATAASAAAAEGSGVSASAAQRRERLRAEKHAYVLYKRQVEYAFSAFLQALWRRIRDHPAILDFFTFVSSR